MGIIEAPTNDNLDNSETYAYNVSAKYITNLFDRKIILKDENIINEKGIEDFIAHTITNKTVRSGLCPGIF